MATLRNLGYIISSRLAKNTAKEDELCEKLNFSSSDLMRLKCGRLSLTPAQITTVANTLSIKSADLVLFLLKNTVMKFWI